MPVTRKKLSPEQLGQVMAQAEKEDSEYVPSPETQKVIDQHNAIHAEAAKNASAKRLAELESMAGTFSAPAPLEPVEKAGEFETMYKGDPVMDNFDRRAIRMYNGIIIEMGPPDLCHQLVVPAMFNHVKEPNRESAAHERLATMMQYVRSINGRKLPGMCQTWLDVMNIIRELRQLGVNAVQQVWLETWPDLGGVYWSDLKKNIDTGVHQAGGNS